MVPFPIPPQSLLCIRLQISLLRNGCSGYLTQLATMLTTRDEVVGEWEFLLPVHVGPGRNLAESSLWMSRTTTTCWTQDCVKKLPQSLSFNSRGLTMTLREMLQSSSTMAVSSQASWIWSLTPWQCWVEGRTKLWTMSLKAYT